MLFRPDSSSSPLGAMGQGSPARQREPQVVLNLGDRATVEAGVVAGRDFFLVQFEIAGESPSMAHVRLVDLAKELGGHRRTDFST